MDSKFLGNDANEEFILNDTNLLTIKDSPEFNTNESPSTPTNKILSFIF